MVIFRFSFIIRGIFPRFLQCDGSISQSLDSSTAWLFLKLNRFVCNEQWSGRGNWPLLSSPYSRPV